MNQNIDEIKTAWGKALDSDVIRAATRDWYEYSLEVQEVIESEVGKRGLSDQVSVILQKQPRVKRAEIFNLDKRELSSSWTFFDKVIFPIFWSGLFGAGTACLFLQNQPEAPGFLVALIIGSLFIWFSGYDLKKVSVDGDEIIISNYLKTCRVPMSEIVAVTENRMINPKLIWIYFKHRTPLGQRIKFTPVNSFGDRFLFGRKHAVVKYLESRIETIEVT
jgi:hypothetical protein